MKTSVSKKQHFPSDPVRRAPKPVLGVNPDLEVDKARGERSRHAVHSAQVGLAVAAGDERPALGEFVLTDLAAEHHLIERRLNHRHGQGQLLEVDEPATGAVRRLLELEESEAFAAAEE